MASWWRAFPRAARRYPWPTNVLLYAGLFSAGDALQQRLRGGPADWRQTRRVATLAMTFHGNFNYVWLRLLERALPGRAPRTVLAKVLCDQTVGGPIALSAFYVGMSILQEKDDIFLDLKQKFWNTYKSDLCVCFLYLHSILTRLSFVAEWSHVLALCAADQLQPCPCALEDGIYGTLWLPLGHLPMLFAAERRWYSQVRIHLPSQEGGA
ncbi:mpv17-like protein isoform X1 [Mus pahari]|uniref:mpv17-like protein isoform X1 n=1 Tax=Mus pahari TaxID=10093 RepID=UPI0011148080|nr:mpv17-like protein isoform X1 [Mus pahari]